MKLKFIICAATCALVFLSCNKTVQPGVSPEGSGPVEFGSTVEGRLGVTRAVDTAWGEDAIGVFMYGGTELTTASVLESNKKYQTWGTGRFSAATLGDYIRFPEEGAKVGFVAYHPYSEELSGFDLAMDISDQSDHGALDLLYSDNVTGVDAADQRPVLNFTHQMARIRLILTPGDGRTDIDVAEVTFTNIPTKAVFRLDQGSFTSVGDNSSVTVIPNGEGDGFYADLLVFPGDLTNVTAVVRLADGTLFQPFAVVDESTSKNFAKSRSYTYTLHLRGGEALPENYGWFETPVKTDIENTVFVYHMMPEAEKPGERNYSMLYDINYKIAYWVAYPMHTDYFNEGRYEKWAYDPKVEAQYQARLSGGSFANPNNDRGHQIPNGDRNYSRAGSESTFYSTNMTPQNGNLNQNMWRLLETQIRTWTAQCDTLYVVTGAMIVTADDQTIEYDKDNDGKDIAVPKYYFKALAKRIGNTYYTNAYRINNESQSGNGLTFRNYRTTVTALEQETGFTFFPFLSDETKSAYVSSQWQ